MTKRRLLVFLLLLAAPVAAQSLEPRVSKTELELAALERRVAALETVLPVGRIAALEAILYGQHIRSLPERLRSARPNFSPEDEVLWVRLNDYPNVPGQQCFMDHWVPPLDDKLTVVAIWGSWNEYGKVIRKISYKDADNRAGFEFAVKFKDLPPEAVWLLVQVDNFENMGHAYLNYRVPADYGLPGPCSTGSGCEYKLCHVDPYRWNFVANIRVR